MLCDGFCEGAYHMSCLDPPVTKAELAELGDEDDDWMCRVCDARVDAFYALNAIALPRHVDAATATWHDVFPEEAALDAEQRGPGQANDPAKHFTEKKNAALDEDWASDESDDEDFGGGGCFSDDGADDEDEPLSGSARSSSGSDHDSGDGDEAESPEVLLGKRRRAPVDYRKLNDEMFGTGEAFEGEAEDAETGGWGPASPKKKKQRSATSRSSETSPKTKKTKTRAKTAAPKKATPSPKSPKSKPRTRTPKTEKEKNTPSSARRFPGATRDALERFFLSDARPSAAEVSRLESELGISRHQIKVWFQNRRRKEKA